MPARLPTTNPSKICTITYQCEHSRHFKIEEITSELTALRDHNGREETAVSIFSSESSSASSSPSFLSLSSTLSGQNTPMVGKNNLALLRVFDPEVLCPSCMSTASLWSVALSPSGDLADGITGLTGSEAGDERLEQLLLPASQGRDEESGWWDVLDLDESVENDEEDEGEVSDEWETLGTVVEPFEFV
ncbi:MAG: hypothetical protein Q9169_002616 [Polycauliona sp. 2 TL-2023]